MRRRGTELADGRFVLLHDPAGQESWQGTFRVVTLGRAELEPEMAGDPLLPEVTWSWLTGALEARWRRTGSPSGTVTRSGSSYFGGLDESAAADASWRSAPAGRRGPTIRPPDALPDMAAHLTAWCELLCQCAGLPPEESGGPSVVSLPKRRGPQPRVDPRLDLLAHRVERLSDSEISVTNS